MEPAAAEAFRRIPYGIYVLTAGHEAQFEALVVSWVSQVSYSPPLLMVTLRRNRKALPSLRETGLFSLSLLRKEQAALVSRLKGPRPDPGPSIYAGGDRRGWPPVVEGCQAYWRCKLLSTQEAGDHVLCLGEVESAAPGPEGSALTTLDYGKTYIGQF